MSVGGGYLRAGDAPESFGTLFNHFPQLVAAGRSDAPSVYLPQSIGPLKGPVGTLVRRALARIDQCCLRDESSVREVGPRVTVTRLPDLKYVRDDGRCIRLGALATHNDVLASPSCVRYALPLAQACWEVGAPQIRTRATVAGNLLTASPANDTITPLLALGAEVVLASAAGRSRAQHGAPKGRWRERVVGLSDFYRGVRRTVARPDELLREIRVPRMAPDQRGLFLKLGLRRAQAISVINVALVLACDGDRVRAARIALGAVAPTVVRAAAAEVLP